MSWPWALPFVGLLLSIALGPMLFPAVWHHHYGKIATAWALLTLVPFTLRDGAAAAGAAFAHVVLGEYLGFIVVLSTLYVVAGGIVVTGNIRGTPLANTAMLAIGTAMASFVGTTGAAMIMIRPLLRANAGRTHNTHVVIFFILLVANIGGALTPLGDPPLFVGFLRGVDFFWTAQHLWLPTLIVAGIVLAVFFVVDVSFSRGDSVVRAVGEPLRIRVSGSINLLLIACIVASILVSANWRPGIAFSVLGGTVALQNVVRDATLILIALVSLWLTPDEHRAANGFTWEPIREVAILFAGIFVAIIPVLAMLQAGRDGVFAPLLAFVTDTDGRPREVAYFWLTGALSAFSTTRRPTWCSSSSREVMRTN